NAMRSMRPVIALSAILLINSCSESTTPLELPNPATTTFLKDIVVPNLPSPYYHFEYDEDGVMQVASFASGFFSYQLSYANGRLSTQQNMTGSSHDLVAYDYDDFGRAAVVEYKHDDGVVYTIVTLVYTGDRLIKLERRRRLPGGDLELNKELSFSYYPDGNLQTLTTHTPAITGFQPEATWIDLFEEYDDKVNVDAFALLHAEFFDHLV